MNENNGTLNLLKPVNAYNFIIGFVSVIILLAYGHWQLVLAGLLLTYTGFWVLRLLFAITVFIISGVNYSTSFSRLAYSTIISLLLRTIIIISWGYLILNVLGRISTPPSLPFLLLGFFVITTPLNLLAMEEPIHNRYNTSHEALLFDFMLAAAIFLGLVIELNMLSLVLIAGALVLAVRIPLITIDLFEESKDISR